MCPVLAHVFAWLPAIFQLTPAYTALHLLTPLGILGRLAGPPRTPSKPLGLLVGCGSRPGCFVCCTADSWPLGQQGQMTSSADC